MAYVRILDLDGSLEPQSELFPDLELIPARDWGPRIRLACGFKTFDRFQRWLDDHTTETGPKVTLYGSGDFHHVTLALLRQISQPFNLLVLDKHPDWMSGIPFMHCGTWLRHALRLPALRRVFLCGGETDFDNTYRWLAPWNALFSGQVTVFPANRRFIRGKWKRVETRPLLAGGNTPATILCNALEPYREELARVPLYISIDKDVLTAQDAAVNWDSGLLRLSDAIATLQVFLTAAEGRIVGTDLLGDWSPIRLGHTLNRFCDRLDHPSPTYDPQEANDKNKRANAALLRVLLSGAIPTDRTESQVT